MTRPPKPWKIGEEIGEDGINNITIISANDGFIAECGPKGNKICEHNAKFITLLPEMYDALAEMVNDIDSGSTLTKSSPCYKMARAIFEKERR